MREHRAPCCCGVFGKKRRCMLLSLFAVADNFVVDCCFYSTNLIIADFDAAYGKRRFEMSETEKRRLRTGSHKLQEQTLRAKERITCASRLHRSILLLASKLFEIILSVTVAPLTYVLRSAISTTNLLVWCEILVDNFPKPLHDAVTPVKPTVVLSMFSENVQKEGL